VNSFGRAVLAKYGNRLTGVDHVCGPIEWVMATSNNQDTAESSADPSSKRSFWTRLGRALVTFVTAIGPPATVAVAIFALVYTNNATRDQLRLTEQGQITDRFSKAIDQLGQEENNKLAVRLGGIYALEQIMLDSHSTQPTVVDVLCAFVRTHALTAVKLPQQQPVDVQTALTVLGRRPGSDSPGFGTNVSYGILNLGGQTVHLETVQLDQAHLEGVHFESAFLDNASLKGAHLKGAHLVGAVMSGAHLEGADMSGADLDDVYLAGAHLEGADLSTTTGLKVDRLECATTDRWTKLPAGMSLPHTDAECDE